MPWPCLSRIAEQAIQLLVSLAHTVLHSAGEDDGAFLEGADQRGHAEPGPSVLKSLELSSLQGDAVGEAFVSEGLSDDLVRAHPVEAAVEAELLLTASVQVAVGTTGAAVEVIDCHFEVAGPEPFSEDIGVGVGTKHLRRRCVELSR
jgi:hypothetical protein